MPDAVLAVLAGITLLASCGIVTNEAGHGMLSEAMGMGHHHIADYGGYHCANHDTTPLGEQHMNHMHKQHTSTHNHCQGGKEMHRTHHPMTPDGGHRR